MSTIQRVTIEVGDMTIVFYPDWQQVHVIFKGGWPPESYSFNRFTEIIKKAKAEKLCAL